MIRSAMLQSSGEEPWMSGYSVTQAAAAAGINRATLDTWLQRRYVADVPRIGGGKVGRRLSFLQVVTIAALAGLARASIPVGTAVAFLAHEQISDEFPAVVAAGGADSVLTIGWKNGEPFIRMMPKGAAFTWMARNPMALGGGEVLTLLFLDALIERVRTALDQSAAAVSSAA